MYRQKEHLKKEILKKRTILEKELQIEIHKELLTEMAVRDKKQRATTKQEAKQQSNSAANTTTAVTPKKK